MLFEKKQTLTPRQQLMKDLRDHEYALINHDDKAAYHEALALHHKARIEVLKARLQEPEIEIELPKPEKTWNPIPQLAM